MMQQTNVLLVAAALAIVLGAAPATGQTSFTWPNTSVDLAAYTTPEACQAAVDRTGQDARDREAAALGIWRDTLPYDPDELRSMPAAVIETARTCLTRFADADAVPLEDYRALLKLYLTAEWIDGARTLMVRRLEAVDPNDDRARVAVTDTIVQLFGLSEGRSPWAQLESRLTLLDEVLATHLPNGLDQLRAYWKQWERISLMALLNEALVDTVSARHVATRILTVAESLTPQEREAAWEEATSEWRLRIDHPDHLSERLAGAFDYVLGWPGFLDSLRQGTKEYVQAVRAARERATGRPPEAYIRGQSIGERAPTLEGDVWMGCGGTCEPRPSPGEVSLVFFVSHNRCEVFPVLEAMMYGNCASRLITLRRLMDRFPEMSVTVAAAAQGHFGYLKENVTLEREAELLREWLDAFGLKRAVLTVTEPAYWRLPNHDGRRIDPDIANHTAYSFGGTMAVNNGLAFLIDQDGLVVHDWILVRESETEFVERIEILLERGQVGS